MDPDELENFPTCCRITVRRLSRAVKSYAFQDLPLKRIKKLAAQFTDAEVRESICEDEDNRAFLFEMPDGRASLMLWNAFNGPMGCLDDDSVRAYAQVQYLRRHDYPVAHSTDEIYALADRYSWPRKGPYAQRPIA